MLASRYCDWFTVTLPTGTKEYRAHALSREGLLFLATRNKVFVRDPAERDAWRPIFILPPRSDDVEDQITTIGVAPFSRGLVHEAVYVLSDWGAWAIPWERASLDQAPWSGLSYRFDPIALERPGSLSAREFRASSTPSLFGLIADADGDIATISPFGNTARVSVTDHLVNGRSALFAAGLAGTTIAWGYRTNTGVILDGQGHRISTVALPDSRNPDGEEEIRQIATFPHRNLIAVASTRGLFLGRLDADTGALVGNLVPVRSLADRDLSWVGSFLGRIAVVGDHLKIGEQGGVLAIETADGDPLGLASLTFEVFPGGPAIAGEIRALATDLLLVEGSKKLYEFHPQGWTLLNEQSSLLNDLSPTVAASSPAGIDVFGNLISTRLYGCRAKPAGWKQYVLADVATPAHLVPDPSGLGTWLIEQPPSGIGGDAGYIRFLSQHGYSDSTDGVIYGVQHRLARARLVGRDGSVSWPESARGGVLLPIGGDFLWGSAGRWRRLSLPEEMRPLEDLTPAGESGTWGLLGISGTVPNRVVRVDAAGPPEMPNGLTVEATAAVCAGGESHLVPDNERHIWLACGTDGTWHFERIHPIMGEPDEQLRALDLPEAPVFLLKMATSGWVLTRGGIAPIGGGAWSQFADGAASDESSLLVQILSEKREAGRGRWRALWANEDGVDITTAHEILPAPGPGADISESRVLILTRTRTPQQTAWSPGPAFLLDLFGSDPAITPYSTNQQALLWAEPEQTGERRFDISSDEDGAYQHYRDAGSIHIPGLDFATAASRYRHTDFHASNTDARDYSILASTSRAAMKLDPLIGLSSIAGAVVPIKISYRDREGKDQRVRLDSPLPKEPLPTPDGPVSVHFAASPEDWWRAGGVRVRLRPDKQSPWIEATDGVARLRPPTGVPSRFEFELQTANGAWVDEFSTLPIQFAAPPLPSRLPLWTIGLLLLLSLAIVIIASRRIQEKILIVLGRRWTIQIGEADHIIDVRAEGNRRALIRTGGATPLSTDPKLTFDITEPIALPYVSPGESARLRIEGEEMFVETTWPQRIGSRWSLGSEALVAGQIAVLAFSETEAAFARNGRPQKQLRFAALAYNPEETIQAADGSSLDPLFAVEGELKNVAKVFSDWGADAHIDSAAGSATLCTALRQRDVIHVAAHADYDRIYFSNGDVFTAADLDALQPDELRCRLIILSVCHVGRIANPSASLAFQFVKRGVNLIASTTPLDDALATLFFTDLYGAWLPRKRASGIGLAMAIRIASESFQAKDARAGLDALVLYGDPTLHLDFE